jgi:hypothetical protein
MALLDDEELLPFFGNPNIQRQGARARALAAQRDVNTLPDPRTYAAVSGLLGTAPDQMGFSVLNPQYESIQRTAKPAFTLGTLLGFAPLTKGLPVGASIKNIGKTDSITGLPLNADGTVTLFHHTNKTAAEQIAKSGRLRSAGEPSVYLTTEKTTNTGYGDVAVPVRVKPSLLNLDDEFPSGRMDFSIDTGKPKGSVPVTVEKQSFQYPQDEAMRLAQQRAALPVEQGGLGLRAGNTAEQRAKAMGFDYNTTRFHGSDQDIYAFDPAKFGKNDQGWYGRGVTTDTDPEIASGYANYNEAESGQMVYPLVSRGKYMNWPEGQQPFSSAKDSIRGTKDIQDLGYQGTQITNDRDLYGNIPQFGTEQVTFNPENIRSRFAAFDPFRRSAAIAASMGVAAPDLLAAQQDEEMRKLQQLGLLGMVAP